MANAQTEYRWMAIIAEDLEALLAGRHDPLAACDLLWCLEPLYAKNRIAPGIVASGRLEER